MAGYIRYANQGATRNRALDEDLIKRLAYLESMGITAEVFSGGQPSAEEGGARVGSVRHDHGGAGDMHFFNSDGRKLDWANEQDRPVFEEIVRRGKQAGVTGFGAGPGYMSEGSMHVGMGKPGVWGAGGKGDNAPAWLKAAYNGAPSGKPDVVAEVLAAGGNAPPVIGTNQPQAVAQAQSKEETKPESRNGPLIDLFNEATGKNVQVPETIFGLNTDKVAGAVEGMGNLQKMFSENDANLNKQIAASANRSRGPSEPVNIQMASTFKPMTRKRKGSLSGLGGYFG